MKNSKKQQIGAVRIEAILFLISIVVFESGAWLQMSASGSAIRSEVQRNQPYPISYHVLQEFLIVHPYPTNEDRACCDLGLDAHVILGQRQHEAIPEDECLAIIQKAVSMVTPKQREQMARFENLTKMRGVLRFKQKAKQPMGPIALRSASLIEYAATTLQVHHGYNKDAIVRAISGDITPNSSDEVHEAILSPGLR